MPGGGGRSFLLEARARLPDLVLIVVTAWGSEAVAVEMLRDLGAFDYVPKTEFEERRIVGAIRRALRTRRAEAVIARRALEVDAETERGVRTIVPMGYLTAEPNLKRLPILAETVDRATAAGETSVVVDLIHVVALAPPALGLLVCAGGRLERAGGALAVCGARREVAPAVELFDRRRCGGRGLDVHADRETAVRALLERPGRDGAIR